MLTTNCALYAPSSGTFVAQSQWKVASASHNRDDTRLCQPAMILLPRGSDAGDQTGAAEFGEDGRQKVERDVLPFSDFWTLYWPCP